MDSHAILDAILADVAGKIHRAGEGNSAVGCSAVQRLLIPGYAAHQIMPCAHSSVLSHSATSGLPWREGQLQQLL
jgi:hypothetical protein